MHQKELLKLSNYVGLRRVEDLKIYEEDFETFYIFI